MVDEGLLQIEDSVLITKSPDGKIAVSQEDKVTRKGQKAGYLLPLVTAAITGTFPVILSATLGGRLVAKLMDHGVTNRFIKTLKTEIAARHSALIVLGEPDPERRQQVSERLRSMGPTVVEAELPPEVRESIEKDVEAAALALFTGQSDFFTRFNRPAPRPPGRYALPFRGPSNSKQAASGLT